MKKNNIRAGIIAGVLLIAYHLLVICLPLNRGGMFWLSYVFTLAAFGVAVLSLVIAFRNGSSAKSKFFGFPIARVGIAYLAFQAAAGFLFSALADYLPVWLGAVVYIIALGAAVIGLVATDTVRDHVMDQQVRLQADVAAMRDAQSRLNQMVMQCSNPEISQPVKHLAEELRYSDPVSSPALKSIEAELFAVIDQLQLAVKRDDLISIISLCQQAEGILSERNRLCKLYKN